MAKPVFDATDAFFFGPDEVTEVAPYLRDSLDVKRLMSVVIVAAAPALVASVHFFGLRVLLVVLTSYIFGGIAETLFCMVRKEEITEGFLVTGLLFPLTLPPTVPLWVVAAGSIFGVVFGKEVFGGTGHNVFNPALVGRCFVAISFPVQMTQTWTVPFEGKCGFVHFMNVDGITQATPLMVAKAGQSDIVSLTGLFLGNVAGSIGETSALLIILGGVYLLYTRVASWRTVVGALVGALVLGTILWAAKVGQPAPPVFSVLAGGFLFGIFFMATDPVTSPSQKLGKWIYGIGIGAITILIRFLSGYVEGVMFAILLMNAFAPLIDEVILYARYGKMAEV